AVDELAVEDRVSLAERGAVEVDAIRGGEGYHAVAGPRAKEGLHDAAVSVPDTRTQAVADADQAPESGHRHSDRAARRQLAAGEVGAARIPVGAGRDRSRIGECDVGRADRAPHSEIAGDIDARWNPHVSVVRNWIARPFQRSTGAVVVEGTSGPA